ncbi:hypothetical protein KM043_015871 [Ampulex compressa]|nr:hypothetical protein KM043_015871 [Ampulex compressa]
MKFRPGSAVRRGRPGDVRTSDDRDVGRYLLQVSPEPVLGRTGRTQGPAMRKIAALPRVARSIIEHCRVEQTRRGAEEGRWMNGEGEREWFEREGPKWERGREREANGQRRWLRAMAVFVLSAHRRDPGDPGILVEF